MADSSYQIKMNQESAQALTDVLAREIRNRPVMEKRPMTQRCRVGAVGDSVTRRFVLQTEWERQDSDQSYWATAFPVMEDAKRHIEFGHGAPVRIVYPDVNSNLPGSHKGDQVYAGFRNGRWELINFEIDTSVKAKEQFPVLYYERMVEEPLTEEELAENPEAEPKQVKQSWLICPGGNTDSGPTSVIHAFHIEKRKWSTAEFPDTPLTAMPSMRYNAPAIAVKVVEYAEDDIDKEKPLETVKVFYIGGRGHEAVGIQKLDNADNPESPLNVGSTLQMVFEQEEHLLSSMEVFDIRTMKWERNWPGLDGRKPKKESMK